MILQQNNECWGLRLCGNRSGFHRGCRGPACKKTEYDYQNAWKKAKKQREGYVEYVDAGPTRKILKTMSDTHNLSLAKIARVAFMSPSSVREIYRGKKKRVLKINAEALAKIDINDLSLKRWTYYQNLSSRTDATAAREHLRYLGKHNISFYAIAKLIGNKFNGGQFKTVHKNLHDIKNGRFKTIRKTWEKEILSISPHDSSLKTQSGYKMKIGV